MHLNIPDGPFEGYIFDCDGTLADTMPLHFRAWSRIVNECGGTFPESLFYQLGGKPTEQILELLRDEHGMRVPDVRQAALLKESYFVELIHEVTPIAPVVEFAYRWHGRKPMAVASGGLRRYVEMTLEAIGVRHLFQSVVCAEDYVRGKPHPDPFLEAARRLQVAPSACLVFEDSELGLQAAEAAGMRWVFVPQRLPTVSP
jgi:beta-phosphoglucomutase family hydrolase